MRIMALIFEFIENRIMIKFFFARSLYLSRSGSSPPPILPFPNVPIESTNELCEENIILHFVNLSYQFVSLFYRKEQNEICSRAPFHGGKMVGVTSNDKRSNGKRQTSCCSFYCRCDATRCYLMALQCSETRLSMSAN